MDSKVELRSQERCLDICTLYMPSQRTRFRTIRDWRRVNCDGVFKFVHGTFHAIFRYDERVHLACGPQVISLTPRVTSKIEKIEPGETRRFRLFDGGMCIYDVSYTDYEREIEDDFTMTDPEDFDIFLLMQNVVRDSDRQVRFYAR